MASHLSPLDAAAKELLQSLRTLNDDESDEDAPRHGARAKVRNVNYQSGLLFKTAPAGFNPDSLRENSEDVEPIPPSPSTPVPPISPSSSPSRPLERAQNDILHRIGSKHRSTAKSSGSFDPAMHRRCHFPPSPSSPLPASAEIGRRRSLVTSSSAGNECRAGTPSALSSAEMNSMRDGSPVKKMSKAGVQSWDVRTCRSLRLQTLSTSSMSISTSTSSMGTMPSQTPKHERRECRSVSPANSAASNVDASKQDLNFFGDITSPKAPDKWWGHRLLGDTQCGPLDDHPATLKKLNAVTAQLTLVQAELAQQERLHSDRDSQLSELRTRSKGFDALEDGIQESRQKVQAALAQEAKLSKEVSQKEMELKKSAMLVKHLQQELVDLSGQSEVALRERDTALAEQVRRVASLGQTVEMLKANSTDELKSLRKSLQDMENTSAKNEKIWADKLQAAETVILLRDQRITKQEGNIQQLMEDAPKSNVRKNEEQIPRTKSNMQQMQAQLQALDQKVKQRDSELSKLRSQLESEAEVEALKGKIATVHDAAACDARTAALKSSLQQAKLDVQQLEEKKDKDSNGLLRVLEEIGSYSSRCILSDTLDLEGSSMIGSGRYGYVMSCKDKATGKQAVIKASGARWLDIAANEYMLSHDLDHPNIVKYTCLLMHTDQDETIKHQITDAFSRGQLEGKRPTKFSDYYICLVLEYVDGGTVTSLLSKNALSIEGVASITRDTAAALAYLHDLKRTHNDIKLDNVLLQRQTGSDRLVAKLADLGLAEHSVNRTRDFDLFANTVWCMGLGQTKFAKVPRAEERHDRIQKFAQAIKGKADASVCTALVDILDKSWKEECSMLEVANWDEISACEVILPA